MLNLRYFRTKSRFHLEIGFFSFYEISELKKINFYFEML